jgi:GNAT superfamily N-acetyltransferase
MREPFLAHQFEAQRIGYADMFPGSEHEVIMLAERPVGRIWVDWSADACLIVDLALRPEHRGQGIGTHVVEEVLARADRAGLPVRAHVERMNGPGLAFWLRLGFEETGGDVMYSEIERPAPRRPA